MKDKYTSTIAGATILMAGIGIISRGLGFFREVTFAGYYGLSSEFDLYLIGTVIPLTLNTIILFIAQNIFVPYYNRYKNEGVVENFLYQQLRFFLSSGIILSLILFSLSNLIINIYQPNIDKVSLVVVNNIFRISLISIPLNSLNSVFIVYLQAHFNFKHAAISQLFLNIIIIGIVILLSNMFSIYAVPLGYVLGTAVQTFYLIRKTKIKLISILSFKNNFDRIIPLPIKSLIIITAIESVGQLYVITDRFFFSQVDKGGIAAINYAQNIFYLPVQIFSLALTTAIFPKLSEQYSNKLYDKFTLILNNSVQVIITIFIPITMVLLLWGDLITIIFYERGKFVADNSLLTFQVLQMLALSLIFYSVYAVLNKVFYTTNLIGSLLIVTITGTLIKIFLNIILVKTMLQNGLALSTTITYIYYFIASLLILKRKNIFFPDSKLLIIVISSVLNSVGSFILVKLIFLPFANISVPISVLMIISFLSLFLFNLYFFDKKTFSKINILAAFSK